ncbi:MAG TPA: hypothetical protein VN802_22320 [Stellaceae bacterium]|nr:hypothetical protein [Stellaceae bacterium]
MARKPQVDTFEIAASRGAYDEYPVFGPGKDPQLHLSRNDRPQPFHLICEQDSILVQLSGNGRVEFRDASVRFFDMTQGDFVYIPGGVPHHYSPTEESVQYRFKAEKAGLEGVAWYCPACGAELHRDVWDTARELPQEAYLRASAAFNRDEALRRCKSCGTVHPPVDTSSAKWAEIADELRAELGRAPGEPTNEKLTIAPHPTKHPLKQNVYWMARIVNSQLTPMFPYLEPGSIVPCISLHRGGEASIAGHFVHFNSIDEVVLSLGAVNSYIKPGFARVGTRSHGVGSFNAKPDPEDTAAVNVITQRHPRGEEQREAVTFVCHSCKRELHKREFNGNPAPSRESDLFTPELPTIATIVESCLSAQAYNAMGPDIVCPSCGAHNAPFPLHRWGWDEYLARTRATLSAMRSMARAAGTSARRAE